MNRSKQDKINMALKVARTKKRLTQLELANAVNPPTTEQTIWAIEHCKRVPRPRLQREIARVLEVSIDELFPLEDEDEPAKIPA